VNGSTETGKPKSAANNAAKNGTADLDESDDDDKEDEAAGGVEEVTGGQFSPLYLN
jgi:hypothetical protein